MPKTEKSRQNENNNKMKKHSAILSFAVFAFLFVLLTSFAIITNANIISHNIAPDGKVISGASADSLDSVVDFLLSASAKDFFEHQPPVPVDFRNVQLKFFEDKYYLICGEFLVRDENKNDNWIEFTTIKTSGYEQWIGTTSYCQKSKAINYKISDLSSDLKSRFESLQNAGK